MTQNTYSSGWKRVLKRAGIPHVGTHGIRHRAATDIADSGVPTKVGMALTAHKTVTMFMRYVHNEDDPIRAAAETVAKRRQTLIGAVSPQTNSPGSEAARLSVATLTGFSEVTGSKPAILDAGQYTQCQAWQNCRRFDIARAKTERSRQALSVPPERGFHRPYPFSSGSGPTRRALLPALGRQRLDNCGNRPSGRNNL